MDIRTVLERTETVTVVGCSRDPGKAAHAVPRAIQRAGFRIVPVNPGADEILGEKAYPTIADVPVELDLVNVFRPSAQAADVVRRAIDAGAKAVWLQSGIVSPEGRRLAKEAGIPYVEDRCIKVERARLGITKG